MKKYKIGDVAKLLDVSTDTIRYYEKYGLISPKKDKDSNYRYFDVWDINFLLDSKRYKSCGFSLNDIKCILKTDDIEALNKRCENKEAEIIEKIDELKSELAILQDFHSRTAEITPKIGSFKLCDSPDMAYICQRQNDSFDFGENIMPFIKRLDTLSVSFAHTFMVRDMNNANYQEKYDYNWGFSIAPDVALSNHIELKPPIELVKGHKSFYSVFTAGEQGTFMESLQQKVLKPIIDYGYEIQGDIYGNLIVRLNEEAGMLRIFEVWVPI